MAAQTHRRGSGLGRGQHMLTMAVGQSDDVDPQAAVAEAIEQCRAQLAGRTALAAMLFVAFDSYEPGLCGAVRDAFGGIDVMGSTSAAEMSSTIGYREDSVALAVFASDNIDCVIGFAPEVATEARKATSEAVRRALARTTQEPRLCIVLTEGNVAQLVMEALREELPGVLVVGGAA